MLGLELDQSKVDTINYVCEVDYPLGALQTQQEDGGGLLPQR
jgi:hypothetical protein